MRYHVTELARGHHVKQVRALAALAFTTVVYADLPPLIDRDAFFGANDPRVNKRNSDEIVIAAREHHVPVEYLVAPDEGHGFARPINNLAIVAAMERFMAKYLDARFQQSMPTDVQGRLKQITVDPATVALAAQR